MVAKLTELLNDCWRRREVPSVWRQGTVVKLPKKGDLSDCNNWHGIALHSIPGKVLCRILMQRLKNAVDVKLREEQADFRAGRSCV